MFKLHLVSMGINSTCRQGPRLAGQWHWHSVCPIHSASIQLSGAHSALSLVVLWGTAAVVQLFLDTTKYDMGHGTVFLCPPSLAAGQRI